MNKQEERREEERKKVSCSRSQFVERKCFILAAQPSKKVAALFNPPPPCFLSDVPPRTNARKSKPTKEALLAVGDPLGCDLA